MTQIQDISDNEIRIIGANTTPTTLQTPEPVDGEGPERNPRNNKWKWIALTLCALIIAIAIIFITAYNTINKRIVVEPIPAVDSSLVATDKTETAIPVKTSPEVTIKEDTINDITVTILTPKGCKAELHVGAVDTLDRSILLCAQAADVRGDNGEIVSAYILKGEPLSRGIAKKGFCAIIDGAVTLGMSEETPLYERVVDTNGDFFRQYPLVHDSVMQENKPKGKAIRKALCILDGDVCIITSNDRESFHDFAQALKDYGVTEAIALTGSDATLFARTKEGILHNYGKIDNNYKNINFIIFKEK